MSRAIADSISLLSETLGNCKTNLKEKSVENVDNIKISDVDEKIAEIQAGVGSGNEIDLSEFSNISNFGIVIIFTEEFDYGVNKVTINDGFVDSGWYAGLNINNAPQVVIFFDQSYINDSATIKVTLEYDGDTITRTYNNIRLEINKLTCIE